MRIYIDCEFNSYKGELISMALCAENGAEFYECLPCNKPDPWVAENVMPILMKDAISYSEFQKRLKQFLNSFQSIHIVSDWPEDIKHFCEALITGPGKRIDTPPLTMEVLRVDAKSDIPHNALADARGLLLELKNAQP